LEESFFKGLGGRKPLPAISVRLVDLLVATESLEIYVLKNTEGQTCMNNNNACKLNINQINKLHIESVSNNTLCFRYRPVTVFL